MLVSLEGVSPDCAAFLAAVGDDDAASELQAESNKKIAMNVKSFFISIYSFRFFDSTSFHSE